MMNTIESCQVKINYIRKRGVKHLRITIRQDGQIRVTIPWCCPQKTAEEFVRSKERWIQKTLIRVNQNADKQHSFQFSQFDHDEFKTRQLQLFERLRELAAMHGFRYRKAAIRNQKSRWGSCSTRNHISLNVALIAVPAHLRDYVLLHELTHTEHKNHSKAFWARLEQLLDGKATQYRKELNRYQAGIK